MGDIIAEVTFQDESGLPKDRFVNVFNFSTAGAIDATALSTAAYKIGNFYNAHATGLNPVSHYLSPRIVPAGAHVKFYDRAAATPRPVLLELIFDISSTGTGSLPEEVALCLSYYTDRNVASHRGRIYLGPLSGAAISTVDGRPLGDLVIQLVAAGTRLAIAGAPPGVVSGDYSVRHTDGSLFPILSDGAVQWALWSPKLSTLVPISHGWVDNEWDGQRRRRVEATARTTF